MLVYLQTTVAQLSALELVTGTRDWNCHCKLTSPKVTPKDLGVVEVTGNQRTRAWFHGYKCQVLTTVHLPPHDGGGRGRGQAVREWNRKGQQNHEHCQNTQLMKRAPLWIHGFHMQEVQSDEKGRVWRVSLPGKGTYHRYPLMQKHGFLSWPNSLLGDFLTFLRFHRSVSRRNTLQVFLETSRNSILIHLYHM